MSKEDRWKPFFVSLRMQIQVLRVQLKFGQALSRKHPKDAIITLEDARRKAGTIVENIDFLITSLKGRVQ